MNTQHLLDEIGDRLLQAHVNTQEIDAKDGIRFFWPLPAKAEEALFLGSYEDFCQINQEIYFYTGGLYIVCYTGRREDYIPFNLSSDSNSIIVQMEISDMLLLLKRMMSEHWDDTTGEQVLLNFFETVSEHKLTDYDVENFWLPRFKHPLHKYHACILIEPKSDSLLVGNLRNPLQCFFPTSNIFPTHRTQWIILFSQDHREKEQLDLDYDQFSKFLEEHNCAAGISYIGSSLGNFYASYLAARAALHFGLKNPNKPTVKSVYEFRQYNTTYLIHLAAREYSRNHKELDFYGLAHPDVIWLARYDQENRTDYLKVLMYYLNNKQSLSQTAQALFVHRNTVYYKITKIEELLGHPLNLEQDAMVYLISGYIMEYINRFQNRELN